MRLLVLLLAVAVTGCANRASSLALTEDVIHDHLAAVDDEYQRICGPQGTTPKAPELGPACAEVKPVLLATLEAGAGFNTCVLTQKAGCLVPVVEAGGNLVTALRKLPQGEVARAITAAVSAVAAAVRRSGGS